MSSAALKNVVIIGGASGGAQVAHALEKSLPETHRLVLIESNEFAYWPIAGLRASVKPGFESQVFASFDNFFGKGSRHIVLAGYSVTEVTENTVKLNKAAPAPFDSDSIPVEVGVISSGTQYAIPMRPMSTKLDEAMEGLRKMQRDVAEAKHILVVGGGPVGVEFTGEVLFNHPGKKVTLVDHADTVVKGYRAPLSQKLLTQMKNKGVDVRLKTSLELTENHLDQAQKLVPDMLTIKLSDGTEVETDFLFIATGGKPNIGLVPSEALDNGKPKRIDVNSSTLRLIYPPLAKKWFALGDVANAPGAKTHVNATNQAPIVAAHVASQINSGSASTKAYKAPGNVMVVPFGENGGAAQMFYPVFGEWVTTLVKSKALFLSNFLKTYPAGAAA